MLIEKEEYLKLSPLEQNVISSKAAEKILETIKYYDENVNSFGFDIKLLDIEEKLFDIISWSPMTQPLIKDMKQKLDTLKYVHKMTAVRNMVFTAAFIAFLIYKAFS